MKWNLIVPFAWQCPSNVAIAVEAGIHEAERIGELHAVMVIPRPLDDLEHSLPMVEMAMEKPVRLPLKLQEKQSVAIIFFVKFILPCGYPGVDGSSN
jgi:hypothetical protein